MPYPLPADVGSVSGVTWKLIAIPDDPAYTRAGLDRYSTISDVWNWGAEGIEDDSYVARQQWLTAVLLTLELWDMNPLETIIGHIDGIEALLEQLAALQQQPVPCCPAGPTSPTPAAIDEAVDSVPQVIQDNYTTGNDWGVVWESFFCPYLRQWFQDIDDKIFEPMEPYVNAGLITASIILGLYVSLMGIGGAVLVAGIPVGAFLFFWDQFVELVSNGALGDYSGWDALADDFICAVRDADGPAAKSAAGRAWIDEQDVSPMVQLIFWMLMDEEFWRRLYSGIGADGNEIMVTGDGCPTCGLDFDFEHAAYFETNYDGFTKDAAVSRVSDCANMTVALSSGAIEITGANAAIEAGFSYTPGGSFYVVEVVTDVCTTGTLRVTTNGGITHDITSAPIVDTWEPSQASPAANMRFQAISGGGRISSVVTKWRYEPPA